MNYVLSIALIAVGFFIWDKPTTAALRSGFGNYQSLYTLGATLTVIGWLLLALTLIFGDHCNA